MKIRTYCRQDLAKYIETSKNNAALKIFEFNAPSPGLIKLDHEVKISLHLLGCEDLTPRENAAAHLLIAITSHYKITWLHAAEPPCGCEPLPPLATSEGVEFDQKTVKAIADYAAFLPESERTRLIAAFAPTVLGVVDNGISAEPTTTKLQTTDSIKERRKQHDITAERGCRRHILELWDKIELEYGKGADGHQVLRVIKRDIDVSYRCPQLKTVQNKLAELRSEKLIPR
jgi:hypothetical protein